MKYMTPDLLARFRSADEDVAESATDEWEVRCADYRNYLGCIESGFPRSVRGLLRRYCLHDARVLTVAQDEKPFFSIFLQPRGGHDGLIELRYRLMRLKVHRHKALEGDGPPLRWWLYDEFDVLSEPIPVYTHSILLTGGWEFEIVFLSLSVRRIRKLVLPTADVSEGDEAIGLELLAV